MVWGYCGDLPTPHGCAAALALPYPTVAGTNPAQTWAAFVPAYTDT